MVEKILYEICDKMTDSLSQEQIQKLKNVLYIVFHNKIITEECTEIVPTETNEDLELIKMFMVFKRISGRKESTLLSYKNEILKFRCSLNKNLKEVNAMDIRYYLANLTIKQNNSLVTIRNKFHVLNSFYTFLEAEEIINKNPCKKIETVKINDIIKEPYTARELEAIRNACRNYRERALIETLYSTGLRVSEFCSLNINHIDFNKQEFNVIGKGNKERKVYLSDSACFYLQKYLEERFRNNDISSRSNEPLFINLRKKERIDTSGVQWIVREIGKRGNVTNVHPHRFRRTFATDLLERGMKVEEIMILLGHSRIETTMIYCKVNNTTIESSFHKYI